MQKKSIPLLIVIALFAVLGTAYSVAFPIFESWDENHHYDYVRYLVEEKRIPVQDLDGPETHFFQPPAYYLVTAALTAYLPADSYRPEENSAFAQEYWYEHNKSHFIHPRSIEGWPWHGTALNTHIMRFLSVIWGIVILILADRLIKRIVPDETQGRWLWIGAITLTALQPSFLYLMASINSMVLAAVISTALTLLLVNVALKGLDWRLAIMLGIGFGLALLTRWTLAPLAGVFVGAVVVSAETWKHPWQTLLRAGVMVLIALAIGGWWYVRNTLLYGDPLGLTILYEVWGEGRPGGAPSFVSGIPLLFLSYWGSFGPWGSIRLPDWMYIFFTVYTGIGIAGLAWRWFTGKFSPDDKRAVFVLGSVIVGFYVTALISGSQSRFGVQQRWLMAAHVSIMLLLAVGWWHIFQEFRWPNWTNTAWMIPPFLLVTISLFGFILPAYSPPKTVSDPAELEYDTSLDVQVGDFARLIGASVTPRTDPGERIWARICWEAQKTPPESYWLFAHVVGVDSQRLTEIDSLPGLGNYPTVDWQAGQSHCTDWPLRIPEDALPGRYTVQTGLYERESQDRLYADANGQFFDPPIVGTVIVEAQPGPIPEQATPVDVDFSGVIRLRGIQVETAQQGYTIRLFWEALADLDTPYTVYIHLTPPGDNETLLAQSDGVPRQGLYPTDLWPVGGLIPDTHTLVVPDDLPPGEYDLRIGLYDPAAGTRLQGPEFDFSYVFSLEVGE